MKTTEKDIELIERYLDGDLSGKEKTEFEKRLGPRELISSGTKKDKCPEGYDPGFRKLYDFREKMALWWKYADEYEKTKKKVAEIIASEKKRKKLTIVYSIAAALFICLAIPLAIYNNQGKQNKMAGSEEYKVGADYPEYDASIRYFDKSYKQLLPADKQTFKYGKPILFKWDSELEVQTAIVIKQTANDSIIWRVPVPSKLKQYELKKELDSGGYAWEMEGFDGKKQFEIE